MVRRTLVAIPIALVLAGCQDAAGPERDGLTEEEVAGIARAVIGSTFEVTSDGRTIDAAPPDDRLLPAITTTVEVSLTLPCAEGGDEAFDGTRVRVWDVEARSRTDDFTATHLYQSCARAYDREEEGPVVITLDGELDVEAHHAWQDWRRAGLQTLSLDGELDWAADDGRTGTCPIEIDVTFDPETRTQTVEGVFCDTEFSETTTSAPVATQDVRVHPVTPCVPQALGGETLRVQPAVRFG